MVASATASGAAGAIMGARDDIGDLKKLMKELEASNSDWRSKNGQLKQFNTENLQVSKSLAKQKRDR